MKRNSQEKQEHLERLPINSGKSKCFLQNKKFDKEQNSSDCLNLQRKLQIHQFLLQKQGLQGYPWRSFQFSQGNPHINTINENKYMIFAFNLYLAYNFFMYANLVLKS